MLKNNAIANTPVIQNHWKQMSDEERLKLVKEQKKENERFYKISLIKAKENGQVIITFKKNISAGERGIFLLDFERYLKDTLDQGINVWCEPIGDKNSLRNMRGIQIKS